MAAYEFPECVVSTQKSHSTSIVMNCGYPRWNCRSPPHRNLPLVGHSGHWGPVVVEIQDCQFEGLLFENVNAYSRPIAYIQLSRKRSFNVGFTRGRSRLVQALVGQQYRHPNRDRLAWHSPEAVHHSALMPAALISGHHFSISALW